jgi:transposase
MAPLVRRTWAPVGETPLVVHRRAGQRKVSIVAALCLSPAQRVVRLFFQVYPERNITRDVVIDFLKQLLRHIPGPMTLVWDRLQAHRAREVQEFLGKSNRINCWYLPPYAPELNPVEYAWSYLKMNPPANVCPTDVEQLGELASRRGYLLSRRQDLLRSFTNHSPLFYCRK